MIMMSLRRGGVGPNNDNRGFSWPPKEEERPNVRNKQTNKQTNKEEEKNRPEERKSIKRVELPEYTISPALTYFDGDDYDDGVGRECFYWQFCILKVKAE